MATEALSREPVAVQHFFDAVNDAATPNGDRRTVGVEAARAVLSDNSIRVPGVVQQLLGAFKDENGAHADILDSVLKGVDLYRREHGFTPDASLIEHAVRNAATAATRSYGELITGLGGGFRLDAATSAHHDQLGLNPVMAGVSIMAQFAEAVPYAAYLPADVKSNIAKLAILSNQALTDFGDYTNGSTIDGVAGGLNYMDSQRLIQLTANGGAGPFTGQVAQRNGVAVGAGNVAMPLLRGRGIVLVNGLPSAREMPVQAGTGNNTVSGSVTIAGTTYTLGGTINTDTGAYSITTSAALPALTVVSLITYIDYEVANRNSDALTPVIGVQADVFDLFARASRALVRTTIDAMTQMQNELNIDGRGQSLLSVRNQYAQERHFRANALMRLVAAQLTDTWSYDVATQIAQKDRSQIWMNLAPILAGLSQRMANVTVDHGITTLYMTGELAAQARGLPNTIWEPSGLTDRPGIYRLGRLFGQYDVYYTPIGLTETGNGQTSQILCVGRATTVARNPIVMGDAVPPIFLPVSMNTSMQQPDAFYVRNFTELNPHLASAQGAALINVTGIK